MHMQDEISLARALREGTAEAHRNAERSHFTREFLRCNVDKRTYISYLTSFQEIYSALEEELEKNSKHLAVQKIHFPRELDRLESIVADLAFLTGSTSTPSTQSTATLAYVSRIRHVSKYQPELLVAHAYVRYLGDLSGGQILSRKIRKALSLPADGQGSHFYSFTHLPSTMKEFKSLYRSRLDEVPEEYHAAIVEEAKLAFELNAKIFDELDALLPSGMEIVGPEPRGKDGSWCQRSAKLIGVSVGLALSVQLAHFEIAMHERNPYSDRPDFGALAEKYQHLRPYIRKNKYGQSTIDFKDPKAVRELTYALLWVDFGLRLEIPLDTLCPPVPNRLDYVLLIQDLLAEDTSRSADAKIRGIDMCAERAHPASIHCWPAPLTPNGRWLPSRSTHEARHTRLPMSNETSYTLASMSS
ncbi:hypothetical protein, variant [Spizellomyces punctatus DAOM BR117]|uniref:heme oxygenase (biliverdin-producing) n=1 Tax=Spizellomyces punctatus (strain DAOM BR117) TaxID=645134 RepID=A0A0L0HFW8_SPIPD|nr:hypothetical protein, variant [Spizellomyces punctatus DAOM BR117]KND00386.1 hypothetical protein, variant [Spizellomyces punctatus DAOM BR117]|eukprot:XP_016608425.1 hypothetical protein, variant [Spizellomyces punctatus DAOM BR117]